MPDSVENYIIEFKKKLELSPTFQQAISTHHNAIRTWIESEAGVYTKLIGSIQRNTRIQPRQGKDNFDIDILVVLGSFDRWATGGVRPGDALDTLESIVSRNKVYKKIGPETDSPVIILEYEDETVVELVPAYKDLIGLYPDGRTFQPVGRSYWIPQNGKWVLADYDYDAEYISKLNSACDNFLIPSIKLLKAIKRGLFPEMKSYHLEVLASAIIPQIVNQIKIQSVPLYFQFIISTFFYLSKNQVLYRSIIPYSNSLNADYYMTQELRKSIADVFNKIDVYLNDVAHVTEESALKYWETVMGDNS
jgi:hypothetical protein